MRHKSNEPDLRLERWSICGFSVGVIIVMVVAGATWHYSHSEKVTNFIIWIGLAFVAMGAGTLLIKGLHAFMTSKRKPE